MLSYRAPCGKVLALQAELEQLGGGRSTRIHRPHVQIILPAATAQQSCVEPADEPEARGAPAAPPGAQPAEAAPAPVRVAASGHGAGATVELRPDAVACSGPSLPNGIPGLLLAGFDASLILCGAPLGPPAAAAGHTAAGSPPASQLPYRPLFAAAARLLRAAAAATCERAAADDGSGGDATSSGDARPLLTLTVSAWTLGVDDTLTDALAAAAPACGLMSPRRGTHAPAACSPGRPAAAPAPPIAPQAEPPGVVRIEVDSADQIPKLFRLVASAAAAPAPRPATSAAPAATGAAVQQQQAQAPPPRALFCRLEVRVRSACGARASRGSLVVADLSPVTSPSAFEAPPAATQGHGTPGAGAAAGAGGARTSAAGAAAAAARWRCAHRDVAALLKLASRLAAVQGDDAGSAVSASLRDSALLQCVGPLIAGRHACHWALHLASPPAPAVAACEARPATQQQGSPGAAGAAAAAGSAPLDVVRLVRKARAITLALASDEGPAADALAGRAGDGWQTDALPFTEACRGLRAAAAPARRSPRSSPMRRISPPRAARCGALGPAGPADPGTRAAQRPRDSGGQAAQQLRPAWQAPPVRHQTEAQLRLQRGSSHEGAAACARPAGNVVPAANRPSGIVTKAGRASKGERAAAPQSLAKAGATAAPGSPWHSPLALQGGSHTSYAGIHHQAQGAGGAAAPPASPATQMRKVAPETAAVVSALGPVPEWRDDCGADAAAVPQWEQQPPDWEGFGSTSPTAGQAAEGLSSICALEERLAALRAEFGRALGVPAVAAGGGGGGGGGGGERCVAAEEARGLAAEAARGMLRQLRSALATQLPPGGKQEQEQEGLRELAERGEPGGGYPDGYARQHRQQQRSVTQQRNSSSSGSSSSTSGDDVGSFSSGEVSSSSEEELQAAPARAGVGALPLKAGRPQPCSMEPRPLPAAAADDGAVADLSSPWEGGSCSSRSAVPGRARWASRKRKGEGGLVGEGGAAAAAKGAGLDDGSCGIRGGLAAGGLIGAVWPGSAGSERPRDGSGAPVKTEAAPRSDAETRSEPADGSGGSGEGAGAGRAAGVVADAAGCADVVLEHDRQLRARASSLEAEVSELQRRCKQLLSGEPATGAAGGGSYVAEWRRGGGAQGA